MLFRFQCLHPVNWNNKAGSTCSCIWEKQTWRRGRGQDVGIRLGHLSKFSRFRSQFHTMYGREGPSSLLYLFLSSGCVLFSDAYGVCWLKVQWSAPLGLTQLCNFFFPALSLSLCPSPFFNISLFLICPTEVRSEERGILERAGIIQSLTVGVAPIVVVIACVCTFTLHMALGYDLNAAEVFLSGSLGTVILPSIL